MAKKTAYRDLKRGPDGTMHTIYIDSDSGAEVPYSELVNYDVRGSSPEGDLEQIKNGKFPNLGSGGLGGSKSDSGSSDEPEGEDEETDEPFWKKNERGGDPQYLNKDMPRTAENNYGYINKPTLLGLAGMLPGLIGFGTKTVNAVVNANNVAAVNAARKEYGLEPLGAGDSIKGIVKDNKGVVGHVKVGDEVVELTLDPDTKEDGIKQMSPAEAKKKAEELGTEIKPATDEEVEAKVKEVGKEHKSIFSKITGIEGDILDNIFGASPFAGVKSPFKKLKEEILKDDEEETPPAETQPTETAPSATPVDPSVSEVTRAPIGDLSTQNIDYENIGPNRSQPLSGPLPGVVQQAVDSVLGPGHKVSVTSGTYPEHIQSKIDQAAENARAKGLGLAGIGRAAKAAGRYGSDRHDSHKAMDFGVFSPNGSKVTDPAQLEAVASKLAELGVTGIGLGAGYMGGDNIHADYAHENAPLGWGAGGKSGNMRSGLREKLIGIMNDAKPLPDAFSPNGIPVPQIKPEQEIPVAETPAPDVVSSLETAKAIGQEIAKELAGLVGPNQAAASEMPKAPEAPKTGGLAQLGESAKQVLDRVPKTRAPEDYNKLAYTISGELGSKTLQGLAAGNPESIANARKEVAAIMSTIDNRAKSTAFAGIPNPLDKVLDPSQYNSLAPNAKSVTAENFQKFGDFVKEAIQDYDQGTNPSPAPNATHYYNPSLVNPDWAPHARSSLAIGEHVFADVERPGTGRSEYQRSLPDKMTAPTSKPSTAATSVAAEAKQAREKAESSIGPGRGLSPGSPGPGAAIGPGRGFSPGGPITPSERAQASTGSRGKGASGVNSVKTTSVGPTAGLKGQGMGGFIGGPKDPGKLGQAIAGDFAASTDALTGQAFGGFKAGTLGGTASGLGSGLGSPGQSKPGEFSPTGMGTISVESVNTGATSKGGVPQGRFEQTITHTNTSGYSGTKSSGGLFGGLFGGGSKSSSSSSGKGGLGSTPGSSKGGGYGFGGAGGVKSTRSDSW